MKTITTALVLILAAGPALAHKMPRADHFGQTAMTQASSQAAVSATASQSGKKPGKPAPRAPQAKPCYDLDKPQKLEKKVSFVGAKPTFRPGIKPCPKPEADAGAPTIKPLSTKPLPAKPQPIKLHVEARKPDCDKGSHSAMTKPGKTSQSSRQALVKPLKDKGQKGAARKTF